MWSKFWPLLLIISANIFYNICTKSMPEKLNPFGALTITYLTAAIISLILFLTSTNINNLGNELKQINWVPFILGLSIIGLEFGYIRLYRAGWQVIVGSLVANTALAVALLIIGVLFYKEVISIKQIFGMILCLIGLIFVA